MRNSTLNPIAYTIIIEEAVDISKILGIPPNLTTRPKISRVILAEIEDKLDAYDVCVLDFGTKCISQLEDWENFFKKNMAYRISRDSNTLTIHKNIIKELM